MGEVWKETTRFGKGKCCDSRRAANLEAVPTSNSKHGQWSGSVLALLSACSLENRGSSVESKPRAVGMSRLYGVGKPSPYLFYLDATTMLH